MKLDIKKIILQQMLVIIMAWSGMSVFSVSYASETRGVLIAAESSTLQKTSIFEIRRIYLGLPSSTKNSINNPVINLSNKSVFKEFLKNVLHMTESGYRRKIVKRVFRQGRKKVTEIKSTDEIVKHLNKNTQDVSFMTEETAKKTKGIRVVQYLW